MRRLILASTSRYRRDLLARLRIDFESAAPGVDEQARPGERPEALAVRLAITKARSVVAPDAVVIGADQVASLDGRVLRKPVTHERALQQLLACQQREVAFHTAAAVLDHGSGACLQQLDETRVRFTRLEQPELDRYLRIEQPYDCAGGFKAEGLGIILFDEIESRDPTALLGLPLIWLSAALRTLGFNPVAADRSH